MAAALWNKMQAVTGRGGPSLAADLKRATDSGVIEISPELLTPIIDATNTEEGRQEVMQHLQQCLKESSGAKWKRVHAGLVLVAELLKRASPLVFVEIAED